MGEQIVFARRAGHRSGRWAKLFVLCAVVCTVSFSAWAGDGIPVTSITTQRTPVPNTGPFTQNGFNVFYGRGDNVQMITATAGGITLTRSSISRPNIFIRRIDNGQSSGQRLSMFYSGRRSGNNIFIEGEEAFSMEQAMNDDFITSGGLDVFVNAGTGVEQPNNIERVDFIVSAGINLPTTAALLSEIGTIANEKFGNNSYKIAAITSLDGFGDPASFTPLATIEGSVDYGNLGRPRNSGGSNRDNIYIRNAANSTGGNNGPVAYVGQDTNFIGMSFVSFAAMGATPGQTVYGYSIFPNDVFDSNDLVGLTNVPLNTPAGTANGADIYGGTYAVFATPAAELQTGSGGVANLQAIKTVEVFDPLNIGLYGIPGNDMVYTISVTNSGNASPDTGTIFIADKLPTQIEFYNGDIDDGGPQTDPVVFIDGGSGLSFNIATDVGYSDSAVQPLLMGDCLYNPTPGYDPNVSYICFAPSGAMANGGPPAPNFGLQFRARVK